MTRSAVIGLLISTLTIPNEGRSADLSVEEVAVRQMATVASIQTLRLNYTQVIHGFSADDLMRKGRYLRHGDVVFIEEAVGSLMKASIRRDSKAVRSIQKSTSRTNTVRYHASIKGPHDLMGTTDLYLPLLFYVQHNSERRFLTFQEYYQRCKTSAHDDTCQGHDCVRIDVRYEIGEVAVEVRNWHDPSRGCLVVRHETRSRGPSGTGILRIELDDWLVSGTSYLPHRILLTNTTNDKLEYTHTILLSSIELNRRMNKSELELPALPSGTECIDYTRMKQYKIDAGWGRIGPESDFTEQRFEVPQQSSDAVAPFEGRTSEHEGWSVWTWLAALSGVVLLTALCYRRIKRHVNRES